MLIVILIFSTSLTVFWLILLGRASPEDWMIRAYNMVFDNLEAMEKLRRKDLSKLEKLSKCHGIVSTAMKLLYGGDSEKKITKLKRINKRLQSGDFRKIGMFEIPGYVLQRLYEEIGKGSLHKTIMTDCYELYGKKHAANKTKHILAKLLSYPMIGLAATLSLGAITMAAGNSSVGNVILGIGPALTMVFTYAIYDDLRSQVKKRREAISRQFPNVVSKLALLVTSGMIMDRAWRETAYSQELELYREMRKTSEELNNLVSPEAAYSEFISRCSTKETARLASAIMQNLSKGNAEIGKLLKDMAREAWQERRHTAKRDAEKANSKLMIPTMLLFLAILVMLMVPVAMNFTGL